MTRRWWQGLLLVAGGIPPGVWVYDRIRMMSWVASTDLEVGFVVTEVGSGNALPGARVEVQSDGGFYAERDRQEFVLVAAAAGEAGKVCRDSMCFGRRSGLGFTDTYAVHLPFWRFRVVAPGYEPGEWAELDVPAYRRQAREVGPRRARLVVPVAVHKSRSEPSR
ncbi:MAG: hypothetical protein JWO38_3167 [Gemmataceae bacterium]|nr:hypothetical protein [Gemmataceae bacterium]